MAEKTKPESANVIVAALKYVFGPLAEKSDRLPAPLAIGLPILVTVLLIAVLKSQLPTNIAWLVGLAIVVPMAGYITQLVLARTVPTVPTVEIHAQPWAEIDSPNRKEGTPLEQNNQVHWLSYGDSSGYAFVACCRRRSTGTKVHLAEGGRSLR